MISVDLHAAMRSAGILVFLFLLPLLGWAHKPSDSYLTLKLEREQVSGQWDIALRDLDYALGLDADTDGNINWGEVKAKHAEIAAYALSRLKLAADGSPCPSRALEQLIDQHSDGAYTVLRFSAACAQAPRELSIGYELFFDLDTQHKGLLNLVQDGKTRLGIFSVETPKLSFSLGAQSRWAQFLQYLREGVWHIWIGFDHILFLLSLLLPAVLTFTAGRWRAADNFRAAFWDVFKIVTSFTVAHSITLSLAALGVVTLPTRMVESAIAASVVLAALNNVTPIIHSKRWLVAFGFGLVHGFGFASVLADLGLPQDALLLALVGFNLGVEAGQLAIVGAFLPLAFGMRQTWIYQRVILVGGSLAIAALALGWLLERALDLQFMPI